MAHYSVRSISAGLSRAAARPGQNTTALAMTITAGSCRQARGFAGACVRPPITGSGRSWIAHPLPCSRLAWAACGVS